MFLLRNEHLAVVLCALTRSLVFASLKDDAKEMGASSTNIDCYSPARWKAANESALQSSKSTCVAEVHAVIEAAESGQEWAMQMLDASSDIRSGLLKGEQCVASFMSAFQMLTPAVNGVNDTIFSSDCCPFSCDEKQVQQIVNVNLTSIPTVSDFGSKATEGFIVGEILTIIFDLAIIIFIIFCTICDFARRRRPAEASTMVKMFSKFSLYTHTLEMFKMKGLPAIEGIKVLSMCWVMMYHQFFILLLIPTINRADFEKWYNSWASGHVKSAIFAVDNFFLVSGFLLALSFFTARKAGKPIKWTKFYLRRYLRFTPSLAMVILFYSFLGHRFVNRSLWDPFITTSAAQCRVNWWINLLYIQNFVNTEEICLLHTWYLAAEMQLFWMASIIMYSLYRWPKYGLRFLSCCMVISVVIPPVILITKRYSTQIVYRRGEQGKIISRDIFNFYVPTYNRGFPYFLGILLGYDVANTKRQLTKVKAGISWAIACVLMLLCAVSTHYIHKVNMAYNLALETVFALVVRPFWSIAVAWVVYACTQGYGGPVTSFLSSPFFQPLGRISYSIYLSHMMIQMMTVVDARIIDFFANSTNIVVYFINLVLSIGLGLIIYLFVETPISVLENILTNRVSVSKQASPIEGFDKKTRISNEAAKDN